MITVQDAFRKFRTNLELRDKEQEDAQRRHRDIREVMKRSFSLDRDFLTGSYKRHTKTKPLKDVDIFCVLGDEERHYRDKNPSFLLGDVEKELAREYGDSNVSQQRRSVCVDFGIKEDENGETGDKVMSFDVVPAFAKNNHYEIPDMDTASGWTDTDPEVHADLAVKAQAAYDRQWKGLVRMMKAWNRHQGKPIKPGFLIEVMALEVLFPPWGGTYTREIQAFFATLADRIHETWPDPAGLGPDVSDRMATADCDNARKVLRESEQRAALAIRLEREGKNGEALRTWKDLFGKQFPLS
ncbi:MAG: nucleotidyltransferase [Chloracidobacterium sp.]|nr:nucleotidyltransferase [Chloracidobacterium sp.]